MSIEIDYSAARIKLRGTIDSDMVHGIQDGLKLLARREVLIDIDSSGGSAWGSVFIGKAMREHGRCDSYVSGEACSAAATVALAGRFRMIAPAGRMMLHKAKPNTGTAKEAREFDAIDAVLIERATGQSFATAMKWINAETWFSADRAKSCRLVHAIDKPVAHLGETERLRLLRSDCLVEVMRRKTPDKVLKGRTAKQNAHYRAGVAAMLLGRRSGIWAGS